jgi:hypothetical protein
MGMLKPQYFCWQFPKVSCCELCHEDWDNGTSAPSHVEYPDFTYFSCCAAGEPTKEERELADAEERILYGNAEKSINKGKYHG